MNVAPTGSIPSIAASVAALGESFFRLLTLEGQKAGLSLAWMLGLAFAASVLALGGWFALLACIVLALVQNIGITWFWALCSVALLNFAAAGSLAFLVTQRSKFLHFPATLRQLTLLCSKGEQHESDQ